MGGGTGAGVVLRRGWGERRGAGVEGEEGDGLGIGIAEEVGRSGEDGVEVFARVGEGRKSG